MKEKIKKILKNVKLFYYFHFCNTIKKKGKSNTISFGKNCFLKDCNIKVLGNNNTIIFGDSCNLSGMRIYVKGDNNLIKLGKKVFVNASKLQPACINAVGGKMITIGDRSYLSNNVEIHTTDYHGIYDKNGDRLNHDKDILIGDDVWICLGVKILKGSVVQSGSVVGAGSLVSRSFDEKNVIIAGNPAKIIKHHVFWKGERKNSYPVPVEYAQTN